MCFILLISGILYLSGLIHPLTLLEIFIFLSLLYDIQGVFLKYAEILPTRLWDKVSLKERISRVLWNSNFVPIFAVLLHIEVSNRKNEVM
jgi:hypothetical protein